TACGSFTWDRNGQTYTATGAYLYTFTNGECEDSITLNLTITTLQFQTTDPAATCLPGSVNLTAPAITAGSQNGLTYTYWLDANATQPLTNPSAVATSGTYYIKATSGGCESIRPVNVSISSTPNLVITNPPGICTPGTTDLTAPAIKAGSDAGLVYTYWLDAAATQPVPLPTSVGVGTYYIKATAVGDCYTIKPVVVGPSDIPAASFEGGGEMCSGESKTVTVNLTGTAPWSITYTNGTQIYTINSITTPAYSLVLSPTTTTTYTITSVTDAKCTNISNSSVTITVSQAADGLRLPTVTANPNQSVTLNARQLTANTQYRWLPPTGLNTDTIRTPVFNYNDTMEYYIQMTSPTGCITVDTLRVVMREGSTTTLRSYLAVPKAWSPNGDGHNDKLFPLTVKIREIKYFRVFNRWGQLMFETNIIGHGWDGTFKGKPQVMDVYTWTVEAWGQDNRYYKLSGNSVLVR
ncbi:MAG: gliding motility-associated C-terminal domain-containing protein, partial [Bacteroidota bacterium]|nr:gliding motility-associated C-terminal domain-containing protein [Bacteroidota bacterium]